MQSKHSVALERERERAYGSNIPQSPPSSGPAALSSVWLEARGG